MNIVGSNVHITQSAFSLTCGGERSIFAHTEKTAVSISEDFGSGVSYTNKFGNKYTTHETYFYYFPVQDQQIVCDNLLYSE